MIKVQSLSLSRLSMSLLFALAAILCTGCTTDWVRQQAAYNRKIQRIEQLLIAAGDADSLAAAAMLSIGPTVNPVQRLTLITRAVLKAPDRPELVWLNVRLCTQVDTCNPEPLEAPLHALDPDNGAEQRRLPVVLVGAGLPQLRGQMGNAKSYAERLFDFPTIGDLPPESARLAIEKPLLDENASITSEAMDRILQLTQGYAYFLQEWGSHTWLAAKQSPISPDVVERATITAIPHSQFRCSTGS